MSRVEYLCKIFFARGQPEGHVHLLEDVVDVLPHPRVRLLPGPGLPRGEGVGLRVELQGLQGVGQMPLGQAQKAKQVGHDLK